MGIGDYGQNEHKFWFPDIEDDSLDSDDSPVPVDRVSTGDVADVCKTEVKTMDFIDKLNALFDFLDSPDCAGCQTNGQEPHICGALNDKSILRKSAPIEGEKE